MKGIILSTVVSISLLASALSSCSSETEDIAGKASYISFTPMEIKAKAVTRGSQATLSTLSSYGVSCSVYDYGGSYQTAALGSYFYNIKVDAVKGTTEYMWPGDDKSVSFFAYAPFGDASVSVSGQGVTGRPVYSYTVPADVSSQPDFITAEVLDMRGGKHTDPVTLTFSHRCADLRLSVYNRGDDEITVHSISVYGVKYSGKYQTGWSLDDKVSSSTSHAFTVTPSSTVASKATVDMTGSDSHIIILPQTVAAGTEFISVDATMAGERKTLTYSLKNDIKMEEGKSYMMKISLGVNYIDVDTSSSIVDWQVEKYVSTGRVETDNTYFQPSVSGGTVTGVSDWVPENQ